MVMVNARGQTRRLVIIRAQENMNAGSLLKKKKLKGKDSAKIWYLCLQWSKSVSE